MTEKKKQPAKKAAPAKKAPAKKAPAKKAAPAKKTAAPKKAEPKPKVEKEEVAPLTGVVAPPVTSNPSHEKTHVTITTTPAPKAAPKKKSLFRRLFGR